MGYALGYFTAASPIFPWNSVLSHQIIPSSGILIDKTSQECPQVDSVGDIPSLVSFLLFDSIIFPLFSALIGISPLEIWDFRALFRQDFSQVFPLFPPVTFTKHSRIIPRFLLSIQLLIIINHLLIIVLNSQEFPSGIARLGRFWHFPDHSHWKIRSEMQILGSRGGWGVKMRPKIWFIGRKNSFSSSKLRQG